MRSDNYLSYVFEFIWLICCNCYCQLLSIGYYLNFPYFESAGCTGYRTLSNVIVCDLITFFNLVWFLRNCSCCIVVGVVYCWLPYCTPSRKQLCCRHYRQTTIFLQDNTTVIWFFEPDSVRLTLIGFGLPISLTNPHIPRLSPHIII